MTRIKRIIRQTPLCAALRRASTPLNLGLAGVVLLHTGALADATTWDCRAAADGRGWQCSEDGQPVTDPVPAMPVTRPPPPAAPQADPDSPPPGAAEVPPPDRQPAAQPSRPTPPLIPPLPPQPPIDLRGAAAPPPKTADRSASPARAAPAGPQAAYGAASSAAEPLPAGPLPMAPMPGQAAALQAFQQVDMPHLATPPAAPVADAAAPVAHPAQAAPATAQRPEPVPQMTPAAVDAPGTAGAGIDQGIDWDTCGAPPAAGRTLRLPDMAADTSAPLDVSADSAVASADPQQAVFSGNVELVQGSMRMLADELVLNRTTGEVDARGGFLVSRPDLRVAGSAAHYQLASGQGQIEQATFRVPAIGARGAAQRAEFLGDGRSRFQDISYTTCRPDNADWLLSADALELDQAEGLGKARKTVLRFLGVPVLYAPAFSFPIDDRRRSGLLVPSLGYSDNTGVDLSVPVYLNLAENYDLTLTPRLMSRRGLMLGGEFRFLTETTEGVLAADYLPNDMQRPGERQDRGSASLRSHSQFGARTEADVRVGYVSDSDFFTDLGDSLALTGVTHIERAAELRYHGDTWDLLGRVQGYQTIDESILPSDRPYSRLPQLLLEVERPDGVARTSYHLSAEYANFYREDSVRGHRVDLFPAISLPLRKPWGYLEPKVGARYTAYRLTDQAAGQNDAPSHLAGMLSLDGGLYFDRAAQYFGGAVTQTLEPRLYYLLVPQDGQRDQPVFDTATLDFSYDNLFRENRFNGPDRFGDANQLTLGLTSRTIGDRSGAELLRASVGQILYFENREVTLPGEATLRDSSSALVGELAARLGAGWRTRAAVQWDPHDGGSGTIDQALAQVSYRDAQRRVFNSAYRLRDGVTQHTDLAAIWPLSDRLSLIGRHHYSLRDDRLLEALVGVEYGRCCWRVRALVRQYTDNTGSDHNLAFLLQLELNGLGRLGRKIDQTLERGIYGYRTDDHD